MTQTTNSDAAGEEGLVQEPLRATEPPMPPERVRALLQAEVDRQGPQDDKRRAAAILAETAIRFVDEPGTSGFIIVGPDGQPRTIVRDGQTVPFTLQDLAAEVRRKYPALFKPDLPDSSVSAVQSDEENKPPPPRDWLIVGSDGFLNPISTDTPIPEKVPAPISQTGTRIEQEVSLDHVDNGRGQQRRDAPTDTRAGNLRASTEPGKKQPASPSGSEAPIADTVSAPSHLPRRAGFRPSYAMYAGALLAICTMIALVFTGPGSDPPSVSNQQTSKQGPASTGTIATSEAPAMRPARPRDAVAGSAEVVDTSTLRVDGKLVRLFGVEWARGGNADDLTRYIAGREVVCTPAVRSDRHRCQIEGRDLSEVVLYNGGGRASPEATPELKAAEANARAAGTGVWQKP
jgi:hypothetical protein